MLNDLLEESVDGMTMDNSSNGAVDGLRDGAQEENQAWMVHMKWVVNEQNDLLEGILDGAFEVKVIDSLVW